MILIAEVRKRGLQHLPGHQVGLVMQQLNKLVNGFPERQPSFFDLSKRFGEY